MIKEKVLIVEDELGIRNFIATILNANDYDAITASSGADAMSMVTSHCPDVLLLDLGLPDMDGMEIVRAVRSWSNVPIVVISARNHERDKVEALDAGADDYITKPFGSAELLARIRAAIRHTRTQLPNSMIANSGQFRTGDLVIDYDKHCVFVKGENAKLTQGEYRIVSLLGKYAGRVLTYDFILSHVWGPYGGASNNQILRVNMANIRRKLKENPSDPKYIHTELGIGYRMLDD